MIAVDGSVVVVGGTRGNGLEIARHYATGGADVVLTGTDPGRAAEVAAALPGSTQGIGLDLAQPKAIKAALADVGPIRYLVLAAIARDQNTVAEYDIDQALHLITLKLVGYTEVIHVLRERLSEGSAIVLFGGLAKDRPYPGSTTVTTVNGGVVAMVRTFATELAPIRVNAIHPGIVGDSPFWLGKNLDHVVARTPTRRLATMADVTDAVVFLLENEAVNGVDLRVDGGWMIT